MAQPVGVAGAPAKSPPPPKAPPASTATGSNPRGVTIAPPPRPTVNDRQAVAQTVARAVAGTPRGTSIPARPLPPTVNDVQAGQSYAKSVVQVFRSQSLPQQKAIVAGALKNPSVPESQVVLNFLKTTGNYQNLVEPAHGGSVLAPLGKLGHIALQAAFPSGSAKSTVGTPNPEFGAVMFGGPKNAPQLLANMGKDAVNLPGETLSTAATLGGDVAGGHLVKAVSDFVNPFIQTAENPAKAFYAHPVDTYLMLTGALHGASRLAAAPVRAFAPEDSALAQAVSTNREGVALTGKLTAERPPYSKAPTVKAGQVALEKARYERGPSGELIPKSESLRVKLMKKGIAEIAGTQERIRRVNRAITEKARTDQITPGALTRAGKAVKGTFKYGAKKAAIPGAEVLSRIADTTIRRPDTIVEDIGKHIQDVSSKRGDLAGLPRSLKAHDAYIKQMTDALRDKKFLDNPGPAFKAAEAYRTDYAPVQAELHGLGHYPGMDAEALQRRELMHYAVTHMDAVMKEDPVKVAAYEQALKDLPQQHPDWSFGQLQKALTKIRPEEQLLDSTGKPLSNAAILEHLNDPALGTGGRMPAYTPDRTRFDPEKDARQARYVSQERRPMPMTKKNTLWNYTHGLTEPGHSALTEQHVLAQGIVDSHKAQNAYLDQLVEQKPEGGYWTSYQAAQKDAPQGYVPINLSQPFHPQESLDAATQNANPADLEEEAVRRSLDLNSRLEKAGPGRYGIVDERAVQILRQHQNQVSPNTALRTIRALNNQFRTVALSTSAKHVPGVAQEDLIRDIANGVGFRSWLTGRRALSRAEELSPEAGHNARVALTGGQLAGMTEAGKTYAVSDHWQGTSIHPVLKAFEATMKTPGPRQLRTAWRAWTHFAIGTTKHLLEQQHQIAFLGKAMLNEHGYAEAAKVSGFMGLAQRAMGLHGQMLDDASRGLFDPAKLRQFRSVVNRMGGKWTDFGPSAQTALMFSPFGLWWINSVKFLMRAPIDMPVKTGLLAAATVGTQQERQAKGLDMFSPGHLPLYEQGGIPIGGKILAQNYYSPFGIANDPAETATSLLEPWALQPANALGFGIDWLGKPLTAVGQNTNRGNEKTPGLAQDLQYVLDSGAASFIPLYTKAEQVLEGGSSPYDVTGNGPVPPIFRGKSPSTKTPGKGATAGLAKALFPVREYGASSGSSSASTATPVIPGSGSVSGAVIPGSGNTSGAVIP